MKWNKMALHIRNQIYSWLKNAVSHNKNDFNRTIGAYVNSLIDTDVEGDHFILKVPEKSFASIINDEVNSDLKVPSFIDKAEKKQYLDSRYLIFKIEKNEFIPFVINLSSVTPSLYKEGSSDAVIVEFSSPNIAKPFHMGHLRSTVVGHFVANILSNSWKVIKVNYLGDWGTQFGIIQAGLKSMSLDIDDLKENPLKVINRAYVEANQSESLITEAKIISSNLEKEHESEELDVWRKLRDLTVEELKETYRVLGITFDEYCWESQYAKGFLPVLDKMKSLGLTEERNDQWVVPNGDKKIALMKNDGTSLYLSRDILAALDRYERHKCKSIKYVVDKSQEDHLSTLGNVVSTLTGTNLVDHVKFGRIVGMSTRKGTSIFLSDILEKATQLMSQQQEKSPNTRDRSFEVTQTLAITTLIVYLLKQRRTRDFTFDWDLALQSKGDTGVKLQYTHSRLCNLEKNCGVKLPSECIPQLINEPEALRLIAHIHRFEQISALSEIHLESSYLVNYSFNLCNMISICLKKLPVKNEPVDIAGQRLLLFHKAKNTLSSAMIVLGLKPLSNM